MAHKNCKDKNCIHDNCITIHNEIGKKILSKIIKSDHNCLSLKTANHAVEFISIYLIKFNSIEIKKQLKNELYFKKFLENIEYFTFYINIYDKVYENTDKVFNQCVNRTNFIIQTTYLLEKNELNYNNLMKIARILLQFELINTYKKLLQINDLNKDKFIKELSFDQAKQYFINNEKFINDIKLLDNINTDKIIPFSLEKKFTFILDEIKNEDINESFRKININTEKDLDITKLKLVFLDIYNKWKDELEFGNSSTYDIIIAYLYTINEIPFKLSYENLNDCLLKHGKFTDNYSMKELINNITKNDYWLEEYINTYYNDHL